MNKYTVDVLVDETAHTADVIEFTSGHVALQVRVVDARRIRLYSSLSAVQAKHGPPISVKPSGFFTATAAGHPAEGAQLPSGWCAMRLLQPMVENTASFQSISLIENKYGPVTWR